MESILKIVKEHKLILIEDCAHCMDSEYKGKVCGSFGDVSMFSLHRTKPLHGLYGGLAVVNNPKIEIQEDIYRGRVNYFKEIKLLMVNNIESLLLNGPIFNFFFWYVLNFFNQVGMNLLDKLSEDSKTYQPGEFVKQIGRININVLVDNLTKLEVRSNSRLTKADAYSELLDGLSLQKKLRFAKYAPMLFPVLVDNISKFRKFMWQNNIDTKTKYMLNISNDTECVAEKLEHSIVYLPFYYALRPKDVKYISSRVNAYFLSKL